MNNNKNPGGNQMTKAIMARRIALLSSSSLGLAAIVSAASLGAVLTPTSARAQSVSCMAGVTPLSGPAVVIPAGTHNPNITCLYVGDTATVSTAGNITVSTMAPGGGINLSAVGADDVTWVSTAGTVTGGAQTNGPVIQAQTATGDITLTTAGVSPTTTVSTTAIEAISAGGNITITTNGVIGGQANNLLINSTNRDGIVAETSGAGAVSLDINNSVAGFGFGGAAVRVTNGTGDVTIDATGDVRGGNSQSNTSAQVGSAFVIDSDGDIVIDSTRLIMGGVNQTAPRSAAIVASGSTFRLTLTGNPNSVPDDVRVYQASLGGGYTGDGVPQQTGQISGGLDVGDVSLQAGGHINLSGVTGGAELNFNSRSRWVLTDTSLMSVGDDVINLDATSVILTANTRTNVTSEIPLGDADQVFIPPGIIDFGDGDDTVNSDGRMLIGLVYTRQGAQGEAADVPPKPDMRFGVRGEIQMLDLEQFNNSGEIWLGVRFFDTTVSFTGTDRFHDDMLYMPGATFHGEEGSVVYMDVNLATAQTGCAPETRDEDGYLPAADCIGLQGGSATGRTELRISEFVPGDRGSYNPDGIVIVDLAGADLADVDPDAFFISPDTPRYVDTIGENGAIEKGIFAFVLGLDADNQQFKLFGIPSAGGQQLPILATAANQLWHTATGGWFQRQVDQRDVLGEDGLGTGAWLNITGVNSTRDIVTTIPIGTSSVDFDNTYEQKDVAVSFGWDLVSHNTGAASWALGAMVGYAQSEVNFDTSGNSANLEGVHAGVYGGLSFADFFVDAAVNGTRLSLHDDVPALVLIPTGTLLDTTVQSLGARVEAGWRWNLGAMWAEPIVGLSTVETEFDDFRLPNDDPDLGRPGVEIGLDNADSRRASVGLRVGADDLMSATAPTSLSLTARRVEEFEGASDITIANTGPDALMNDTFDGGFTQLTGGVGVSNARRTVSGYLNVDAVTGDDYDSLGISAGLRLQW